MHEKKQGFILQNMRIRVRVLLIPVFLMVSGLSPEERRISAAMNAFLEGKPAESRRSLQIFKERNEAAFNRNADALRLWGFLEIADGRDGYRFLSGSQLIAKDPAVSAVLGFHYYNSPRHRLALEYLTDSLLNPGEAGSGLPQRPELAGNLPFYCPSGDPEEDEASEKKMVEESTAAPQFMKYSFGYLPAPSERLFASLLSGLPLQNAASLPESFRSAGLKNIIADPDSAESYTICLENLQRRYRSKGYLKPERISEMLLTLHRIRADRTGDPAALRSYAAYLLLRQKPHESLHVLRFALEKTDFYTGSEKYFYEFPELLLLLKNTYEMLHRFRDAATAEKFLLITELEAAEKGGFISSYREALPFFPDDDFRLSLRKAASENTHNREALVYLILNSDIQEAESLKIKLEKYDEAARMSEMHDVYRNYR